MRTRTQSHPLALAAALSFAAPAMAADVYKWTDDKGVVNYSNQAPAKSKSGKEATRVEDRISVYSADPNVTEAVRSQRERHNAAPPGGGFTQQGQAAPARTYSSPPPPAPQTAYDPCAVPNDPNCVGYPGYGGGAYNRRRPPNLVQPQLTPGAIAGNVNAGTGFTPGLSTQPPNVMPQQPVAQPRASFTLREDDRGSGGRRGR